MKRFRVNLEPPESGWLTVRIAGQGGHISIIASYVPHDSFSDLVTAVHRLYESGEPASVTFNEEPTLRELHLSRHEEELVVECLDEGEPKRIRADFETGCREFARQFTLLLDEVGYDGFVTSWHHRPPRARVRELWSHFAR